MDTFILLQQNIFKEALKFTGSCSQVSLILHGCRKIRVALSYRTESLGIRPFSIFSRCFTNIAITVRATKNLCIYLPDICPFQTRPAIWPWESAGELDNHAGNGNVDCPNLRLLS